MFPGTVSLPMAPSLSILTGRRIGTPILWRTGASLVAEMAGIMVPGMSISAIMEAWMKMACHGVVLVPVQVVGLISKILILDPFCAL